MFPRSTTFRATHLPFLFRSSFLSGAASCDWSATARRRRPNWSVIIINAFARGVAFPPIGNPLPRVINDGAQARVLARRAEKQYRRRLVHPLGKSTRLDSTRPDPGSRSLSLGRVMTSNYERGRGGAPRDYFRAVRRGGCTAPARVCALLITH